MSDYNPNDPSQQFGWAMDRLGSDRNSAMNRYSDLTNMNSDYNRNFLSMMMKQASAMGPSQDQLFSLNKRLGGMSSASSAAFATRQAAAITERGQEQALGAFQKGMYDNERTAQGYLGLANEADSRAGQGWNDKWQFQEKQKRETTNSILGFVNQAIGLAGGGFLGGLFKLGGGGNGTQYDDGSQDPHYR